MTKSGNRIETNTKLIKDLVADIADGETKVPQFQRKFVWKHSQAIDLLDSIIRNFPVGSLLLWRTQKKLAVERNIGDFKLPATEELTPTNYVLDGQQRLTVVYSCLGAAQDDDGFSVVYDLINEKFEERGEDDPFKFPLRSIFDTTKLLNFRSGLISHKDSEKLQKRLDRLVDAISNYRFPVVTLKDLSIEEVGTIFERINSSGTKLSVYDLMVAATWTQNFSLDDKVQEILQSLSVKKFNDLEPNTILKCMSVVHSGSVKKKSMFDLRELNEAGIAELTVKTKLSLMKAVDLLSNEFNIFGSDFLPYEAQLISVCYIYSKYPSLNHDQIKKMRQWFWLSSFGERYRVGGENFLTNDLENLKNAIGQPGDSEGMASFGILPSAQDIRNSQFRKNNSKSVAFTLAISLMKPRSIVNGGLVELASALSVYNQKNFHHFYPKAYLKKINDDSNANSIANMVLLSAADNISISDKAPSDYVVEISQNLADNFDSIFLSNFLPNFDEFDYAQGNYDQFLDIRASKIAEYISNLIK